MIKLSKMTDYAVVLLADMAGRGDSLVNTATLAEATKLPEPTVSKILKALARHNIVRSTRGMNGGYVLGMKPDQITMAHVISATDGPIALTACVDQSVECCDRADDCSMKGQWNPANQAMQSALERQGVHTRVMSAIPMQTVCEPYIRRRAVRHMEKGRVVIFAAGTGNPYFTTDTAAALRAAEMNCNALLKGTQVDGVYSDDPVKNPDATLYSNLTHNEIIEKELKVMDLAAFTLARDHNMPISVFNMNKPGALTSIMVGEPEGTLIEATPSQDSAAD